MDLAHVRPILHAIATVVVPDGEPDIDGVWMELQTTVMRALAQRSEHARRQIEVFLRVVRMYAIARYGRPFTALPAHQRRALLERLERSRVPLIRRSFSRVRTLIFMGYYTRADVAQSIGYQATTSGWESRGGTVATVRLGPALWVES